MDKVYFSIKRLLDIEEINELQHPATKSPRNTENEKISKFMNLTRTKKIQLAQQKMPKCGDLKTMFKKFKVGQCSSKDTRKAANIDTYSNNPIGQPSSKEDCAANQHSPPEIRDRHQVIIIKFSFLFK